MLFTHRLVVMRMRLIRTRLGVASLLLLGAVRTGVCLDPSQTDSKDATVSAAQVLDGVREFFRKTARADGAFRPGLDPDYEGLSDSAFSDLAPVAYAVIIHKTFGWKLPDEARTREFLRSRQRADGSFFNRAGTVDPDSAAGRAYNTTMGVVAMRALNTKPLHDPLPVFNDVLKEDYRKLPLYMTSFFPLAYLASDSPIPHEADRKLRALMTPLKDGYLNEHVASTFHAVHYYRLLGQAVPDAAAIRRRVLREQKRDGSWLCNPPARDRHATFDAVFTLRQLGPKDEECRRAIERAAAWARTCRNNDGGFGHFPGSVSDADACYFQIGTLVMAGFLPPAKPLPKDARLLGWGHLLAATE